jgi:superfamily I DNA and/or RNA helicase
MIDEAPQAPEYSTLIPLSFSAKKIVLIGDTRQIGNMILDKLAARNYGYDYSLMQGLLHM